MIFDANTDRIEIYYLVVKDKPRRLGIVARSTWWVFGPISSYAEYRIHQSTITLVHTDGMTQLEVISHERRSGLRFREETIFVHAALTGGSFQISSESQLGANFAWMPTIMSHRIVLERELIAVLPKTTSDGATPASSFPTLGQPLQNLSAYVLLTYAEDDRTDRQESSREGVRGPYRALEPILSTERYLVSQSARNCS